MLFFWQVSLVDTFSLIQFFINTGSQYGAIVVAAAVMDHRIKYALRGHLKTREGLLIG